MRRPRPDRQPDNLAGSVRLPLQRRQLLLEGHDLLHQVRAMGLRKLQCEVHDRFGFFIQGMHISPAGVLRLLNGASFTLAFRQKNEDRRIQNGILLSPFFC